MGGAPSSLVVAIPLEAQRRHGRELRTRYAWASAGTALGSGVAVGAAVSGFGIVLVAGAAVAALFALRAAGRLVVAVRSLRCHGRLAVPAPHLELVRRQIASDSQRGATVGDGAVRTLHEPMAWVGAVAVLLGATAPELLLVVWLVLFGVLLVLGPVLWHRPGRELEADGTAVTRRRR